MNQEKENIVNQGNMQASAATAAPKVNPTGLTMPKLNLSGLAQYFKDEKTPDTPAQPNAVTSTTGQQNENMQPTQQDEEVNPDVVSAQEEFKDIKNGDTYVDKNGQQWVWSAIDFKIVPEEAKDGIVDELEVGEIEEEDGGDGQEESNDAIGSGNVDGLGILRNHLKGSASANDDAIDIVQDAISEILGDTAIAQDYSDKWALSAKRQGFTTDNPNEISATAWKKGKVTELPDLTPEGKKQYKVDTYMTPADKKALENARQSHRRHVAATYENCKAKDKARCPYHGAAFMSDVLKGILQKHGISHSKFGIIQYDPEIKAGRGGKAPLPYRLIFATPSGASPEEVKSIAREFLTSNPNILFDREFDTEGAVFKVKDINYEEDDMPVGAPSEEGHLDKLDTAKQREYAQRARARGSLSWASLDEFSLSRYFDMLNEHPNNIVECADDMLRYAQKFEEYLPEGTSLKDVEKAYKAFMKANAKRDGLDEYIVQGTIVDGAEALARAAKEGREKDWAQYEEAAGKVYHMADEIFGAVRNGLMEGFWNARRDAMGLPNADKILQSTENGEIAYYLGDKYKCRGKQFPMRINSGDAETMRELAQKYIQRLDAAQHDFDEVIQGCEQREPLLVYRGICTLYDKLNAAIDAGKIMGDLQDKVIANSDPKWLKKHGIKVNKGDTDKDISNAGEQSDKVNEKTEPQVATIEEPKEEKPIETNNDKGHSENQPEDKVVAAKEEEATENAPVKEGNVGAVKGTKGKKDNKSREPAARVKNKKDNKKPSKESKNTQADDGPNDDQFVEEMRKAAKKDKNLIEHQANIDKMRKMFGEDSQEYQTAYKNGKAAVIAFCERYKLEHGKVAPVEQPAAAEPVPKQEDAQKSAKHVVPQNSNNRGNPQKTQSNKQNNASAAGNGISLVKSIKVPDTPTLESATEINEKFAELEKRLRGLASVYKSKTSDSQDWQDAEAEMTSIKSAIDQMVKDARGKGYQWTKDSGSQEERPLGVPVNFRISGIKGEDGETISVPYNEPKAGEMYVPKSKDKALSTKESKTTTAPVQKPFVRKSDYSQDYEKIDEKITDIGAGVYKGQNLYDKIADGYVVKAVRKNDGSVDYLLGMPDESSSTGITMQSKSTPPINLNKLFTNKMGGKEDDNEGLRHFVEAIRWKIRDYRDENF